MAGLNTYNHFNAPRIEQQYTDFDDGMITSTYTQLENSAREYTMQLKAAQQYGMHDQIIDYGVCFEICPTNYKELAQTIREHIVGKKTIHCHDVYNMVCQYFDEDEDLGFSIDHMLKISVKIMDCIKSKALEPRLICTNALYKK